MNRRIRIDQLDLDLRGVDPAVAEAAVHLLGPALQAQFSERLGGFESASRVDAGRVAPTGEPQALATRLAQRIAQGIAQGSAPRVAPNTAES
ncbi:MAG: hypothetical protein ABI633_08055 [Burkholderiales bacterium]